MMRRTLAATLAVALSASASAAQAAHPWSDALQAVVVTTRDWDSTRAEVRLWERSAPGGAWRPASSAMSAVVGRSGLGWGRGLMRVDAPGPLKQEGDGRAPAGVFRLPFVFGYAPAAEVGWIRMPYRQSTEFSRCVDDSASIHYNRWVDVSTVQGGTWSSHELMRRSDELYRLGVWVDHNVDPARAGDGSCIFLHLWAGPEVPTVGCTAFAPESLERVLRWMDPAARPVLVQLPEEVYARHREAWGLP
jgi:L,D-peptidoglycan transpeptidase YkuD (ErfK/YbiS/YcfS/YnhG family)